MHTIHFNEDLDLLVGDKEYNVHHKVLTHHHITSHASAKPNPLNITI